MKKQFRILPLIIACLLLLSACVPDIETTEPKETATQTQTITAESTSTPILVTQATKKPTVNAQTTKKPTKTQTTKKPSKTTNPSSTPDKNLAIGQIPKFDGKTAYVALNNNVPKFTQSELTTKSFERYAPLDSLGRCGVAYACVGKDIMPTEDRGSIGQVKPSGWHTVKYDIVDGKYLYNRCHLIGFQLTGENANESNLITGTRYLNIEGMLPFENLIADYVKETGNHVLYRVTPIFEGSNLVASGVQMEGYSVEDDGDGVCFNVFAYNAQPGISINYANGESSLSNKPNAGGNTPNAAQPAVRKYILNTNSKKFHLPTCSSADDISSQNKDTSTRTRDQLIQDGFSPCGRCKP